jgi:CBS domain-containing protein
MQVNEIMTRNAEVIRPDSTIQDAAQKMEDLDVGSLPVCDGDRLLGMVTDRDVTVRAVSEGSDPWTTPVRDVMTRQAIYCLEDQDVAVAARIMKNNQVRRLPVLSRDHRLVGILALADLAVDLQDDLLAGNTLEAISEPAEPRRDTRADPQSGTGR